MLSSEWQRSAFTECLSSLLGVNYEAYLGSITDLVSGFFVAAGSYSFVFVVFVILGMVCGNFLTKFLVRRTIAKRAWWKFILVNAIDSVLTVAIVIICIVFVNIWAPSLLITGLLAIFLFGAMALIEAYFTQAFKKVEFKKILTPPNVLLLLASNLIILAIAVAVTVAVFLLTNALVGLLVGYALLQIAWLTVSMNAEAYVKGEAEKSEGSGIKNEELKMRNEE